MAIAQSITTNNNNKPTIKFMLSYGGRILPRYPDGKLRYHGGQTRVLSVDRSISFSDLVAKLSEMCGKERIMSLRCQFPNEDLDALVSITSDEDLANIVEEYDRFAIGLTHQKPLKIRAFLSIARNAKRLCNDPNSSISSASSSSSSSSSLSSNEDSTSPSSTKRFAVSANKPPIYPNSPSGKYRNYIQLQNLYQCRRHHVYANHWQ